MLFLLVGRFSLARDPAGTQGTPYDTIDQYAEQHIEGWKVLVNKRLFAGEYAKLREQTLKLLGDHLYRITRVVPAEAVAKLRKIPVWIELAHPLHPCMCYHVSPAWLREHHMNPQKAGAVEIANAKNFLSWTLVQPWMVLHELAHGYHDQVLGYDNAEIRACFERAVSSKSYESVLHYNGKKVRAYALTNDREYFAEATEAYFGTNDFYPFVRAELAQHDPAVHDLLEKLWGVHKPTKK
ncbi:MAG TPA: hypothetical protein VK395_12340 [Gemmataceae bacterium]|nr:hypothetical protein [Gemmataceae bacterium]